MASNKLLLVMFLVAAISCDLLTGEKEMLIPMDETMENTGVQLQFTSIETFDLIDGDDAQLNIQINLIDYLGGENINRVDLYLYSMSVKGGEYTLNLAEDPVKLFELPIDHLHASEDGLHGSFTIFLKEVIDKLTVELMFDDIVEHDVFVLQWRIGLNNGLTITDKNCSGKPGIFQTDKFCSKVQVINSLPEFLFTGNYRFSQQNEATFGAVYTSENFEAELRVNHSNKINGRIFDAEYLGQFGFGVGKRPQPIIFLSKKDTSNNSVTLEATVGAGLGCSDLGLFVGPEREHNSHFERSDDSKFTLGITENTEGDCGASPVQVVFDVDKL